MYTRGCRRDYTEVATDMVCQVRIYNRGAGLANEGPRIIADLAPAIQWFFCLKRTCVLQHTKEIFSCIHFADLHQGRIVMP